MNSSATTTTHAKLAPANKQRSPLAKLVDTGQLANVKRADHHHPATADPDAIRATHELITRLEANLTPIALGRPNHHSAIPLRLDHFLEGMRTIRNTLGPGPHTFADIGSGIGTKLALAHALGFQPEGIENHEPYIEVSRRLFPHIPIHHTDAANYQHYHKYDVVYAYRPAVSRDHQHHINQTISDQLKPGALFYSVSSRGPHPDWLEQIDELIWRKP